MADPIKIQVVLDDGEVKGTVDKIKGFLKDLVDGAKAGGAAAGKGYGDSFNNGASSALDAGAQSAKAKTKELGSDLEAQAKEAGQRFGSSLGGAIHAAFELNFDEVIKKLGEVKEAGAAIGEALAGGGGALKDAAAGIEATGAAAEGASSGLVAFAAAAAVVAAAVAALGAGFLGLGHILAEHIVTLDRLSRSTDVSIQDLATWGAAFEDVGGNVGNFESSLLHLQNVSEQARQGNQKFAQTLLDNKIISKDATEQWLQAVNAIAKLTDQTEKIRLATTLFGRENAKFILSLKGIEEGAAGVNKEFEDYGKRITPEAIEQTRKLEESQHKLAEEWDKFKTSVGTPAIGTLNNVIDFFTTWGKAMEEDIKIFQSWDKIWAASVFGGAARSKNITSPTLGITPQQGQAFRQLQPLQPGVGPEGPVVTPEQIQAEKDKQAAIDKAELEAVIKGAKEKLSAGRQLAEAERQFQAAKDAAAEQLAKDANERQLRDLDDTFKKGIIDFKTYYDDRLTLVRQGLSAEASFIEAGADRTRAQIADLNSELQSLQKTRADAVAAKDKAGITAADAEILAVQIKLQGANATLIKQYNDLAIVVRNYKDSAQETNKEVVHSVETLGEEVKLLEDKESVTNRILKQIKEQGELAKADPLVQERERLKASIDATQKLLEQPEANLAARQQEAFLQATAEIVDADQKATLEIIKDRVLIADATIFHSTRAQAILLDHLAQQKSVTQSVGDAMIAVYEGVAGAIDQGIGKLTAKLGIFGDAVREVLSGITRSVLTLFTTTLLGNKGGGGAAGGGGGGTVGSFLNALQGGGGGGGTGTGGGGILGALFPSTGGASSGFGSIGGLLAGVSAPALVNLNAGLPAPTGLGVLSQIISPDVLGFPGASSIGAPPSLSGATAAAGLAGGLGGILQGFFGKGAIASGLPGSTGLANFVAGIGGAGGLAVGALGVGLGSGLGGTSTLGKILGGIGGGIAGIGVGVAGTAAGLALAGGAGLAGLTAALAPILITLGAAAAIAAPFLIAAILLSRASQRKKDEALADSYWKTAADQIVDLTRQVNSDKIDGQDALTEAIALRSQAVAQISTIKTASVRDSRLKNQIPDLDRVYIEPLKRAVEAQARRRATGQSIVPEFASGGYVAGVDRGYDSVLARLRPGEAVLTREQQARLGGEGALRMAGVPGFAEGGYVSTTSANSPMTIYLDVTLGVSEQTAGDLVVTGATTPQGQKVVVRTVKQAQKNREL